MGMLTGSTSRWVVVHNSSMRPQTGSTSHWVVGDNSSMRTQTGSTSHWVVVDDSSMRTHTGSGLMYKAQLLGPVLLANLQLSTVPSYYFN